LLAVGLVRGYAAQMPAHLRKNVVAAPKPSETAAKRLGAAVRRLRKAKKLTQEKLAERADLSTNSVGSIERGENDVTISTLRRVAAALDCTASTLLDAAEL